jgi:deoxyribose-phosphate aldolase
MTAENQGPAAQLTAAQLAAMIDHTFLKPHGTSSDIETLCVEALEHQFVAVVVNPAEVETAVRLLAGSRVRVCTVIGFPLGQSTTAVKDYETRDAVARGATELDLVLNIRALQAGRLEILQAELAALAKACRAAKAISKVILETCYLTDAQKRDACQIALGEGIDFVKTSTGLGPGGATVPDVQLMRSVVGTRCGVKASGGIRDLPTALAMFEAGATRIGTSAGVAIIKGLIDATHTVTRPECGIKGAR